MVVPIGALNVQTLMESKKGRLGNRVDCALAHTANNVTFAAKGTAVIGIGAGLTYLATKYPGVSKALYAPVAYVQGRIGKFNSNTVVKSAKDIIAKNTKSITKKAHNVLPKKVRGAIKDIMKKAEQEFAKLSKSLKAGGTIKQTVKNILKFAKNAPPLVKIGIPLILLGIYATKKVNEGRIEQKYEDIAQLSTHIN